MNKLPRKKKCKICRQEFQPERPLQSVCGFDCAIEEVNKKRMAQEAIHKRAERVKTKKMMEAIKPKQKWLKEAEAVINRYARLRDYHFGCISCDKPPTWGGQWHASHFRSVGAASAIRFNLWNIHKSCSICNNWKSGNLSEYEPRLRAKIGDAKVDWLRAQNQRADYSIEYLKRLKSVFAKKAKRLEKRLQLH